MLSPFQSAPKLSRSKFIPKHKKLQSLTCNNNQFGIFSGVINIFPVILVMELSMSVAVDLQTLIPSEFQYKY